MIISKYQLQHGITNFNYQMDHIIRPIFRISLNISQKSMEKRLVSLQLEYM